MYLLLVALTVMVVLTAQNYYILCVYKLTHRSETNASFNHNQVYSFIYTKHKTDGRCPIGRPWFRIAELRGECRYENWNTIPFTRTFCGAFNTCDFICGILSRAKSLPWSVVHDRVTFDCYSRCGFCH